MIKLQDILKEIALQEQPCINTQLLLEGKISRLEYSKHIQTLEEGLMGILKKGKEYVVKWFKENILKKLVAFIEKAAKFVKGELDTIIFGLKKLLSLVDKFKEKHPFLFKLGMVGLFIIVFLVISTTTAQAQDPAGMGYSPNSLDTMHGLVNNYTSYLEKMGNNMHDILMAKTYLKDLKDGTLNVDYPENAKTIASGIENIFRDLKQTAKDGGGSGNQAIEILENAFESGKNSVARYQGETFK
jgi:hypothetical protein